MFIGSYCKQQRNNNQRQGEPKADQNRPMKKQVKEAVIELSPFPNPKGLEGEELENALCNLWLIIKADPLEMYWEDERGIWHLRTPQEIPPRLRPFIKSIHYTKQGRIYYDIHNKDKAQDALLPYLMEKPKVGRIKLNFHSCPPPSLEWQYLLNHTKVVKTE